MKRITKYHKRVKTTFVMAALVCSFLLLMLFNSTDSYSQTVGYYVVKVGDKTVGTCNNAKKAEEALAEARVMISKEADSIVYVDTELTLEQENRLFAQTDSKEELTEAIYEVLEENVNLDYSPAYMIVSGDYSLVVDSIDSVAAVLETLESTYDSDGEYNVILDTINTGNFTGITYDVEKVETDTQATDNTGASEEASGTDTLSADNGKTSEKENTDSSNASGDARTESNTDNLEASGNVQEGTAADNAGSTTEPGNAQEGADADNAGNTTASDSMQEETSTDNTNGITASGKAQEGTVTDNAGSTTEPGNAHEGENAGNTGDPSASDGSLPEENTDNSAESVEGLTEDGQQENQTVQGSEKTNVTEVEGLKAVGFTEDLEIKTVYVDSSEILTAQEAIEKLQNDGSEAIGVVTVEVCNYDENFYAETQYIEDDTMYVGTSQVVQEACPGTKNITARISYVNGWESEREILEEEVTLEPVPEIIKTGTKPVPTFVVPVDGWLTSTYGERWGVLHEGNDYGCDYASPIWASCAGTVSYAGWNDGGYGYMVVIEHGDGLSTRYAHMCQVACQVGQQVQQFEVIGYAGNTGYSLGVHCHFEIMENGVAVDPFLHLD